MNSDKYDNMRFAAEHAISPEVWEARPYVRWTTANPQPVREAYKGLSPGQRAFMTGLATQSDGLVITRYAPPGLELSGIYPEIRPDRAVRTGPSTTHNHPDEPGESAPINPRTGRPLSARHIHNARSMQGHIARARAADDHAGLNHHGVHSHEDRAKYVFPPSNKRSVSWEEDHVTAARFAGKFEKLEAHLARWHDGVDVEGTHSHSRMVKDPSNPLAMRIDMHPLAVEKFETAERAFFVIEGCIKADAILSAGEAVLSVPSVTLWEAPELRAVAARYLYGKTVVIVPDSDWSENPAVLTQAVLLRTFLRTMGLRAIVAAPPADADGGKQGVDDFLAAGGVLDDLIVLGRYEAPGLRAWLEEREPGRRVTAHGRNEAILGALSLHAGQDGTLSKSLRSMAKIICEKPNDAGSPILRQDR